MAHTKIRMLGPIVKTMDTKTVRVEPKKADDHYLTPEHRKWRAEVIANAGGRCQATEGNHRCWRAEPKYRMFADHIRERSDGGAALDVANGQCLCGRHHTLKTNAARAARLGARQG